MAAAAGWAAGLKAAELVVPQRITVETEASQVATYAVGLGEFASIMGVSKTRLSQLEGQDPRFPASGAGRRGVSPDLAERCGADLPAYPSPRLARTTFAASIC